jgi:hypothetical protein
MSPEANMAPRAAGMNFLTLRLRGVLNLSQAEALFERRGFPQSNRSTQLALEAIGRIFIGGYNAALTASDVSCVLRWVGSIPAAERGFAAEGAAMGAAVVDALPFSRPMLPACIAAFKSEFSYLAHVGAGWALARVPWRRNQILSALDPVHRWLAIDGLGFHDTYFYHRRILTGWRREHSGYAAHAYDQGVGRALWFVSCGSVIDATRLISKLAGTRQDDLWSGLGLAMAYAGPVDNDDVVRALKSADENAASFAQGVAFACEARALARHVPSHTEMAVRSVWNSNVGEVIRLVREARDRLPKAETDPPRYQAWRLGVARDFLRAARAMQ